jgi:hypothetical protein
MRKEPNPLGLQHLEKNDLQKIFIDGDDFDIWALPVLTARESLLFLSSGR